MLSSGSSRGYSKVPSLTGIVGIDQQDEDDLDAHLAKDTTSAAAKRSFFFFFGSLTPSATVGSIQPTLGQILSLAFLTLTVLSAALSLIPFFIISHQILFELTLRHYFPLPLAVYQTLAVLPTIGLLQLTPNLTQLSVSCWPKRKGELIDDGHVARHRIYFLVLVFAELSFLLHGLLIPKMFGTFRRLFFVEPDGTTAIEWRDLERTFFWAAFWSGIAALVEMGVVLLGMSLLLCGGQSNTTRMGSAAGRHGSASRMCHDLLRFTRMPEYVYNILEARGLPKIYQGIVLACLVVTLPSLVLSAHSAHVYLPTRDPPPGNNIGPFCDPVDTTECLMPFPSSYFTRLDTTTVTGRRIDIQEEALKSLYKARGPIHPSYVNEMDGFSTGGPIVFYLEGMREGNGMGANGSHLPAYDDIASSLTSNSVTLLLDIDAEILVPHFSEFDTIDLLRPSIVMQPASPLRHNTTYAVAVVNAVNSNGVLLSPSAGLTGLLASDHERSSFYRHQVIPTLQGAAPWISQNGVIIQMLFDFTTASSTSQLGVVRAVRDGTLRQLNDAEWNWSRHVEVIKIINRRCRRPKDRIARVIHAQLDVPWFLSIDSPRHRASYIDREALLSDQLPIESVKFIVLVPCSLVTQNENATNLTAIVDYGHSFLYSRQELLDSTFLHKMANENGYILVASNWRGMSRLDLPIVLRTFVSEPHLFSSLRDNIIQGYGARVAIQHFCRRALLDMDFMSFQRPRNLHRDNSTRARYLFYGISQGGVLGGAYAALAGARDLLDGTILGNPGTPFSLLMPRSDIFPFYETLMLLNLRYKRHVRIVLSLMQIFWDSVEVSGVLSPPLTEPYPETVIYTGLGDSTVTTLGAEVFARAYGALIVEGEKNLRPFGLASAQTVDLSKGDGHAMPFPVKSPPSLLNESTVIFTEILYEKEWESISVLSNTSGGKAKEGSGVLYNDVHWCTRLDPALQHQINMFIMKGAFVNPCQEDVDRCIRPNATC